MAKKIDKELGKKELGKLKNEANAFKEFISRGNVVDMAVGVIAGGAFGKIVTSLVNDMLMPLIGVLLGGLNFSDLSFKISDATIAYGNFIQSIIDFLIISLCVFTMVRLFDKLKKHEKEEAEVEEKKSDEAILLEEIRDLLKAKK